VFACGTRRSLLARSWAKFVKRVALYYSRDAATACPRVIFEAPPPSIPPLHFADDARLEADGAGEVDLALLARVGRIDLCMAGRADTTELAVVVEARVVGGVPAVVVLETAGLPAAEFAREGGAHGGLDGRRGRLWRVQQRDQKEEEEEEEVVEVVGQPASSPCPRRGRVTHVREQWFQPRAMGGSKARGGARE
jgi:hypothetical protein